MTVAALQVRALAQSQAAARSLAGRVATVIGLHRHGVTVAVAGLGGPIFVGAPGQGLLPFHVVVRSDALDDLMCRGTVGAPVRFDLAARRAWALGIGRVGSVRALGLGMRRLGHWLREQPACNGLGCSQAQALAEGGLVWRALQAGSAADAADTAGPPTDQPAAELHRLIGRGAGSTPAGDDVLIGALAHAWLVDGAGSRLRAALLPVRETLGALTTPLGATYLRAALDGSFGSHLVQLCRAVAVDDPRLAHRALRLAGHGASSGIDTLVGFVAAHELRVKQQSSLCV